jgi:hypothetical protein
LHHQLTAFVVQPQDAEPPGGPTRATHLDPLDGVEVMAAEMQAHRVATAHAARAQVG